MVTRFSNGRIYIHTDGQGVFNVYLLASLGKMSFYQTYIINYNGEACFFLSENQFHLFVCIYLISNLFDTSFISLCLSI